MPCQHALPCLPTASTLHGPLCGWACRWHPPPAAVVVLLSLSSLPTTSLHCYSTPQRPAFLMKGRLWCQSLLCHDALILRCGQCLSVATSASIAIIGHHPPLVPSPSPGFHHYLPLLIVKCPSLKSSLVSVNSDAFFPTSLIVVVVLGGRIQRQEESRGGEDKGRLGFILCGTVFYGTGPTTIFVVYTNKAP